MKVLNQDYFHMGIFPWVEHKLLLIWGELLRFKHGTPGIFLLKPEERENVLCSNLKEEQGSWRWSMCLEVIPAAGV